MNLEHHHRRIRRKVRAVHYGLLPLTLLVVPAWIYAYSLCADEETAGAMKVCVLLRAMPFAPVLLGVAVMAFVARDLSSVGHEAHFERHGVRPAHHSLKHAVHGYRAIDRRHRRHVQWAVVQILAVALGVAIWLAYKYRQTSY